MPLSLVTSATAEPVTRQQFKAHARITRDDEDGVIDGYLLAARRYVETALRRQLVNATWRLTLDCFPACIDVPLPPLSSVSSITYVDTDGATQTLNSSLYRVDTYSQPGRITPAYDQVWPATQAVTNAVTVTFVAGYGATYASVPQTIRQAICLLASHWYENREPIVVGTITAPLPMAVESLLSLESTGAYSA
jgi:uncharacterized phiE125 gp8 family phage protein